MQYLGVRTRAHYLTLNDRDKLCKMGLGDGRKFISRKMVREETCTPGTANVMYNVSTVV